MKIYQSQYGQDEYLDKRIFGGKENGVYIDIGANDGVTLSNTWFFEKHRNWTGICVEPIPETFRKLTENRDSININGCITSATGGQKFLHVTGYAEMLSGLVGAYNDKHLDRIDREIAMHGGTKEIIDVDSYSINDLITQYQLGTVNYCSIDTEGNEFEILMSIDFGQTRIEVLTVENNYSDPDVSAYMKKEGYRRLKKIACDEVFVLRDLPVPTRWKFW